MAGGRNPSFASPDPSSAPPSTGGQFLLQLLQRPPSATPTPPSDPFPHPHLHDPAVAMVGPSHPVPSWPSDPRPLLSDPRFPPPHYSFPPGFSQNPWSLPSFPPQPLPDPFDLRNTQFSPANPPFSNNFPHFAFPRGGDAVIPPNLQMGLPDSSITLTFGSLQCDLPTHNSLPNGNSSESAGGKFWRDPVKDAAVSAGRSPGVPAIRPNEKGSGLPWGNHQHPGVQNARLVENRRPPAPEVGQSRKHKGPEKWNSVNGRRDRERNSEKGDVSTKPPVAVQLDNRARPTGSNLHSVQLTDMEESLANLRGSVVDDGRGSVLQRPDRMNDPVGRELLELAGDLTVEDEEVNKNAARTNEGLRSKHVRSDTSRGLHVSSQRMRNRRKEIACRRDIERFTSYFLSIYESLIPHAEEKERQKQLLASLEKLVSKEWPRAQLYLYGSCANSFGVSKSDIDVCMALDVDDISKPEILVKLAEILESDNLQNVQALTRARVPIVKLMDPVTKISCDICINNVLAVVNTKLLRDYAQIDIRLQQLAFIVKHWAKSRGVNETYQGTLSSYAYVLMCIHFLQSRSPAILPCLQRMKATYAVTIDDVECVYFDRVEELQDYGAQNKESIAYLLWAFFDYWAYRHDYANAVISVRTGSIISKREKDWTRRVGNDRHLICIEDPFEINHDLGRVVDKYSIKILREEFERAADVLQYESNPIVKLFEPYVPS